MSQRVLVQGLKQEGVLYHYTSQAAMHGIVTNRTVWASHVSYMNDSNEIRYERKPGPKPGSEHSFR